MKKNRNIFLLFFFEMTYNKDSYVNREERIMNFNNGGFNNRVEDLTKVFDRRWAADKNKANEAVQQRKEHFNKMFNIQDKDAQRKDMLYQNSVNGQVNSLNERMNAMNQGNRINRMNDFKNGFK